MEVLTVPTALEAISILKKETSLNLVISDYQEKILFFLVSKNLQFLFFYFTDEHGIEIPFIPSMLLGVLGRSQFKELCESVIHLLKRKNDLWAI